MGDLLGFGGGGRAPWEELRAEQVPALEAGPTGAADGDRPTPGALVAAEQDARSILDSQYRFPPPLPWAGPQGAGKAKGDDGELGAEVRRAPSAPPAKWLAREVMPPEQDAMALASMVAMRLAACERRQELQQGQVEFLQRVAADLKVLREGYEGRCKVAEDRLAELERSGEGSRREQVAIGEQFRALQADFREFAGHAIARQRLEMESEVSQSLARQNASMEEWRAVMRQRDVQVEGEVNRLSSSLEELSAQHTTAQTELRARLAAVEAGAMGGMTGGPGNGSGSGGDSAAMEYIRQQLDNLRQGTAHAGAGVAELQARLQGEAAARAAAERNHDARIASLGEAIQAERSEISASLSQRLQVLESRLGVERSDLIARQAELHSEVQIGDEEGSMKLKDLAARLRGELSSVERRLQAETMRLRENVESQLAQSQSARAAEEKARLASLASLFKRVEGGAERQLDVVKGFRSEVDAGLREVREAVQAEIEARVEGERRIIAEVGEVCRASASLEGQALRSQMNQQAEAVLAEFEHMRRTHAERADSLSRYVDNALANAFEGEDRQEGGGAIAKAVASIGDRFATLKASVEEKADLTGRRLETAAEDLRVRLRRTEEAREREAKELRKDSERAAAAVEKRVTAAQEELKSRFEVYVRHFDSTISSVQSAILWPPRAENRIAADEVPAPRVSTQAVRQAAAAASSPIVKHMSTAAMVREAVAEEVVSAALADGSEGLSLQSPMEASSVTLLSPEAGGQGDIKGQY